MYILDKKAPSASIQLASSIHYIQCDVSSWSEQVQAFKQAGDVDILLACAAVGEGGRNYFADETDAATGELMDPGLPVLDVVYEGVLRSVKLALSSMRRTGKAGSVVLVSSAAAYSPEVNIPIYSATKLAVRVPHFPFHLPGWPG